MPLPTLQCVLAHLTATQQRAARTLACGGWRWSSTGQVMYDPVVGPESLMLEGLVAPLQRKVRRERRAPSSW